VAESNSKLCRTHFGLDLRRWKCGQIRMRTRLWAAQAKAKIQSTLHTPRCRTFRIRAIVFSPPKHSSIRFHLSLAHGVACVPRGAAIDRTEPVHFPRTRQQAERDVERYSPNIFYLHDRPHASPHERRSLKRRLNVILS
jgi:hypothetical protein